MRTTITKAYLRMCMRMHSSVFVPPPSGSLPKSVSEADFSSFFVHHLSRVVLSNPPAAYHVIFVAQCGAVEAQP